MNKKLFYIFSIVLLFSVSILANDTERDLAHKAISQNKNEAQIAIITLRNMNQRGLNALFDVYSSEIENYRRTGERSQSWDRIASAIDSVSMQKDGYSSRLFWHTDLEQAKIKAKARNKPILSLRLLGNLNEEFSCANSRFFRSILYSDQKISKYLRENYVLHWKSVRPAPKITIDFGNGRKLVRTITGNSIHYLLDPNGNILDALPGLYNPQTFLNYLVTVRDSHSTADSVKTYWQTYRTIRRNQLLLKWQNDMRRINIGLDETKSNLSISKAKPTALKAAPRAVTKSVVEVPIVRSISYSVESLEKETDFSEWKELADLFGKVVVSKESKAYVRFKTSGKQTLTEAGFTKLMSNLERYIAIDTVQNEYLFHTKIYEWLGGQKEIDLDTFNDRIYRELFLTPKSDKWLGLYSEDIYSALENNGVVK